MPRLMSRKKPREKLPSGACVFCSSEEDNEGVYGKMLHKMDITVHYFCMLFSSGLWQKGKRDRDGILGFMPTDILIEQKRGNRLTCQYCRKKGATIGCVISNCRKTFHFGCGREAGALFQFFQEFRSYCPDHRPCQETHTSDRLAFYGTAKSVCSICMYSVEARSSNDTLRSPCCRKAWFHRNCIQTYAVSAGAYFFKCPLCNNKDLFEAEMLQFGIYIPEQDAAWEQDPDAFQDLLERHSRCDADKCLCPDGREYVGSSGSRWELKLCDCCGSCGTHTRCYGLTKVGKDKLCQECVRITAMPAENKNEHHNRSSLTMASPEAIRRELEHRRSASLRAERAAKRRRSPSATQSVGHHGAVQQNAADSSRTRKNVYMASHVQNHQENGLSARRRNSKRNDNGSISPLQVQGAEQLTGNTSVISMNDSDDDVYLLPVGVEEHLGTESGSTYCEKLSEPSSVTHLQCKAVSNNATEVVKNYKDSTQNNTVLQIDSSTGQSHMHTSTSYSEGEHKPLFEQQCVGLTEAVQHGDSRGERECQNGDLKEPGKDTQNLSQKRGRKSKKINQWSCVEHRGKRRKKQHSITGIHSFPSDEAFKRRSQRLAASCVEAPQRHTRSAQNCDPFLQLPMKTRTVRKNSNFSLHKIAIDPQAIPHSQKCLLGSKEICKTDDLALKKKRKVGRPPKRKYFQRCLDQKGDFHSNINKNLSVASDVGESSAQSSGLSNSNMAFRIWTLEQSPALDFVQEMPSDSVSASETEIFHGDGPAIKVPKTILLQDEHDAGTLTEDSKETKGELDTYQSSFLGSSTCTEYLTPMKVSYGQQTLQCGSLCSSHHSKHGIDDSHESESKSSKSKTGLSTDAQGLLSRSSVMPSQPEPDSNSIQRKLPFELTSRVTCENEQTSSKGTCSELDEAHLKSSLASDTEFLCVWPNKDENGSLGAPLSDVAADSEVDRGMGKSELGSAPLQSRQAKAPYGSAWNLHNCEIPESTVSHNCMANTSVTSSCVQGQEMIEQSLPVISTHDFTGNEHNNRTDLNLGLQPAIYPLSLSTSRAYCLPPSGVHFAHASHSRVFVNQHHTKDPVVLQLGLSHELSAGSQRMGDQMISSTISPPVTSGMLIPAFRGSLSTATQVNQTGLCSEPDTAMSECPTPSSHSGDACLQSTVGSYQPGVQTPPQPFPVITKGFQSDALPKASEPDAMRLSVTDHENRSQYQTSALAPRECVVDTLNQAAPDRSSQLKNGSPAPQGCCPEPSTSMVVKSPLALGGVVQCPLAFTPAHFQRPLMSHNQVELGGQPSASAQTSSMPLSQTLSGLIPQQSIAHFSGYPQYRVLTAPYNNEPIAVCPNVYTTLVYVNGQY